MRKPAMLIMRKMRILAVALLVTAASGLAAEPSSKPLDPAAEKACTEFARKIEACINACDPGPYNRAIDADAIAAAALKGFDVPDVLRTTVRVQWVGGNLGTELVTQSIRKGGSYRFLRLRMVDGQPRALFRLLVGPTTDVNYHEMRLAGWDKGEPKVVDMYFANRGEWLTEEVRHSMLLPVTTAKKGNEAVLTPLEKELLAAVLDIAKARKAGDEGRPADALATLKALPESVRNAKHILMLRVSVASAVSAAELAAAAEDTRKAFPGDWWVEIFLMNHFLEEKNFAAALESIDRLDRCLGGDPFLQVMRACMFQADGQKAKAAASCRKALTEEPKMLVAHILALPMALEAKEFAQAARSLTVMADSQGVGEMPDLAGEPAFAEFLKSEEGRQWQASQKKQAAAGQGTAGSPVPGGEGVAVPEVKRPDPATEKACLAFAGELEKAFKTGDYAPLDKALRKDIASTRIMRGLEKSDKLKEEVGDVCAGWRPGWSLCKAIAGGTDCKLLGIVQVGDQPRAVFRLIGKRPMVLDYQEFVLKPSEKGVEVVDVYTFSSGTCYSDSQRRLILSCIPMYDKGFVKELQGDERLFVENVPRLEALERQARAREFKEAFATYEGLPEAVRREWGVRFTMFVCALNLGVESEKWKAAIDDHYRNHADEPWLDLWVASVSLDKKRYAEALVAIDRLDRRVGRDPYLDFMRARACLGQDKLSEAKNLCQAAVQKEPALIPPREMLALIAMKEKDYRQAAQILSDLGTTRSYRPTALAKSREYADFLASEEGKKWQAANEGKPEVGPVRQRPAPDGVGE